MSRDASVAAQDREARRIEHAAAFGVNPSDVTDEVLDRDQPAASPRTYEATVAAVALIVWLCEEARRQVENRSYLSAGAVLERAEQAVNLYTHLLEEGAF